VDALPTFKNVTSVSLGYDGNCEGTECVVIDFELCVRAEFFVGNTASTGDWNICEWRVARGGDKFRNTTILSLKKAFLKKENYTARTRYLGGHNGWLKDCNDVTPSRRARKPCV
jgi:hypothetical protein